ncbi:MAG: nitrate reductase subunit beta, partial [Acidobacteriota bacterium]|nr:nitrate reductase subunit beta [Acidobacteriota bacterium]
FTAGDEEEVVAVYRKLFAVRIFKRAQTVGDITMDKALRALEEAGSTPREAEDIYYMTSLAGFHERLMVPPMMREQAIEMGVNPHDFQEQHGAGFLNIPQRGL